MVKPHCTTQEKLYIFSCLSLSFFPHPQTKFCDFFFPRYYLFSVTLYSKSQEKERDTSQLTKVISSNIRGQKYKQGLNAK